MSKHEPVSSLTEIKSFPMEARHIVFALATFVVWFALASCGVSSDAALERLFRDHEKEFEQLRDMTARTGVIETIAPEWVRTNERFIQLNGRLPDEVVGEGQTGMSKKEWIAFMKLLNDLSIDTIFFKDKSGDSVAFRVNGRSFFNGDSEKGIEYSKSLPSPLVSRLDHYKPLPNELDRYGGFLAYKQLKTNWYIYLAR